MIKINKVDKKICDYDERKYLIYTINKEIKDSVNLPPEMACLKLRRILFSKRMKEDRDTIMGIFMESPYLDDFVKKFKDFVLSDKYDKIEAQLDRVLGLYKERKGKRSWNKYYK